MKFIKQVLIIILSCFVLQQFLPWWAIVIGCAIGGYWMGTTGLSSFVAGFSGIVFLWLGIALFIDIATGSILTPKVGKVLPLNPFLLTGIIGGLVGGFASLTGFLLKDVIRAKNLYR